MGEKWTTSGRSRLKAKQKRGFGGRGCDPTVTVPAFNANPHNYPTNNPASHPALRERYYTGDPMDAVARRGIIADGRRSAVHQFHAGVHGGMSGRRIQDPSVRPRILSHYQGMNALPETIQPRERLFGPSHPSIQQRSAGSTHVPSRFAHSVMNAASIPSTNAPYNWSLGATQGPPPFVHPVPVTSLQSNYSQDGIRGSTYVAPPFAHMVPNHASRFASYPTNEAYSQLSTPYESAGHYPEAVLCVPGHAAAPGGPVHFEQQDPHSMIYVNAIDHPSVLQSHNQHFVTQTFGRHAMSPQRCDVVTESTLGNLLNGPMYGDNDNILNESEIVTQLPRMDFSDHNASDSAVAAASGNPVGSFIHRRAHGSIGPGGRDTQGSMPANVHATQRSESLPFQAFPYEQPHHLHDERPDGQDFQGIAPTAVHGTPSCGVAQFKRRRGFGILPDHLSTGQAFQGSIPLNQVEAAQSNEIDQHKRQRAASTGHGDCGSQTGRQDFHETVPTEVHFPPGRVEPLQRFPLQKTQGEGSGRREQSQQNAQVDRTTHHVAVQNNVVHNACNEFDEYQVCQSHPNMDQAPQSNGIAQTFHLHCHPHAHGNMRDQTSANPRDIQFRSPHNDAVSSMTEPEHDMSQTRQFSSRTENTITLPIVRCDVAFTGNSGVRLFNEGVEVHFSGNPLVVNRLAGTCGGMPGAQHHNQPKSNDADSDDDLDLAGFQSLWGTKQY